MKMSRWRYAVLLGCISMCQSVVAWAAPPSVAWLYPAGVQRGQSATITAGGSISDWPVMVWCDRSDLKLECDKEKGKLAVTAAADAAPGVAWIRLYNEQGASSPRPLLVGTLREFEEAEPNDELAKLPTMSGSALVVNGRLARTGDVDAVALSLEGGQTLVAMLTANRVLGSPMDGVLQIVSDDGFVLLQNDEGNGLDPLAVFTAPRDGRYIVRWFAFPAVPTSSINFAGGETFIYRLTLSTQAIIDAALPSVLTAGQKERVRLFGWNLPETLATLLVEVPPDRSAVDIGDPAIGNSIRATVAQQRSIAEERPAAGDPQEIELPVVVSGRIAAPGESDEYRFTASKGDQIQLAVAARELGYPLDPHLRLLDAEGKELAENDDSGRQNRDAELSFKVPADGWYRAVLRDLHRHGGPRYFYRLTVRRAEPDYALRLAADSFVLTSGKALEIPVTIDRQNGFEEEIEVSAAGLPAGIHARPVQLASKGGTAKSVKLVLEGELGEAYSGPIRVVATSTGETKQTRAATAPLAGLNTAIEDVWLTVAPKK